MGTGVLYLRVTAYPPEQGIEAMSVASVGFRDTFDAG